MEFGTGANSPFWRLSIGERQGDRPDLFSRADDHLGARLMKTDNDGFQLVLHGHPMEALRVLDEIREMGRPDRTLVSTEIHALMSDEQHHFFGPSWGFNWEFFYSFHPLPTVPRSESVRLLPKGSVELANSRHELLRALRQANPITDAISGFDSYDWFVARGDDGGIAALMGSETKQSVASFHGLGTVPEYRGQGFGAATMVGAVNLALQTHQAIEFGMWSWNEKARRLYHRVGLKSGGENIIGRREPFPNLQEAE